MSNRLKFSASPSTESPCHGVREGVDTEQGRVERVQEMGETVETVPLKDLVSVLGNVHDRVLKKTLVKMVSLSLLLSLFLSFNSFSLCLSVCVSCVSRSSIGTCDTTD